MKVSDPLCPWNDKCFRVVFGGCCLAVEEGESLDIQVSNNAFSALIPGGFSIEDCALMENVAIFGNVANLRKVFCRKPRLIEDTF